MLGNAKTLTSLLDAIGHTPLMQLSRAVPEDCGQIFAKLESFNPGGSVKDRICLQMIETAEREGVLKQWQHRYWFGLGVRLKKTSINFSDARKL